MWTNAVSDSATTVDNEAVTSTARDPWRWFEVTVAAILLLLAVPVLLLAMVAIKITDPCSSVIFRQTRYGHRGEPFTILKLRTMVHSAEELKSELAHLSTDQGPGFKIERDPRITRVGRFLRAFYVDELPQFFNVLMGDMSIVGPRANSFDPQTYEPWQRARLAVKPGITGPWQVARNKPVSFDDRCLMDLDYIGRKSGWTDLSVICATCVMILTRSSGI